MMVYLISIHLMLMLICVLNPSASTALAYFNTSHVNVNLDVTATEEYKALFQYISC